MTRPLYISVCLRTRQDTRPISYSSDIGLYSSKIGTLKDVYGKKTSMAKNKYSKGRRVWQRQVWRISGLLLVLVCRSVPQDPPPGQLKTLLSCRSFYTLRRPRSANQRSRISMRHLADQSAIASCIDTIVQRATSD